MKKETLNGNGKDKKIVVSKKVNVRLEPEQYEFTNSFQKQGLNQSSVIRYCITSVMIMSSDKNYKKLVNKLPANIKV